MISLPILVQTPCRTCSFIEYDGAGTAQCVAVWKLKAVLLYHVVPGRIAAADVTKLTSAKTLNGKSVRIRVSGMNVFVDTAKVTKPDVNATNGVIHVVNRVLIPPAG